MGLRSNDYDCQAADNYYRAVLYGGCFYFLLRWWRKSEIKVKITHFIGWIDFAQ